MGSTLVRERERGGMEGKEEEGKEDAQKREKENLLEAAKRSKGRRSGEVIFLSCT